MRLPKSDARSHVSINIPLTRDHPSYVTASAWQKGWSHNTKRGGGTAPAFCLFGSDLTEEEVKRSSCPSSHASYRFMHGMFGV